MVLKIIQIHLLHLLLLRNITDLDYSFSYLSNVQTLSYEKFEIIAIKLVKTIDVADS